MSQHQETQQMMMMSIFFLKIYFNVDTKIMEVITSLNKHVQKYPNIQYHKIKREEMGSGRTRTKEFNKDDHTGLQNKVEKDKMLMLYW